MRTVTQDSSQRNMWLRDLSTSSDMDKSESVLHQIVSFSRMGMKQIKHGVYIEQVTLWCIVITIEHKRNFKSNKRIGTMPITQISR